MGVSGLWDILRPAGQQRSLSQLAVHDGFQRNPGGRRGLRVGIDASIWFYHATYGREGENPELRTLFFRCARLMSRPFLPLFVFDGPRRPELKRKKKISGKDHWMVSGMQEIIEAFGFEWWCAPGEAEAELAYLNRIGVIDAIITDDVDTFVFGATMIIRNPGKMLSGNAAHPVKNTAGKDDGEHTYTYTSSNIMEHPDVGLSQGGLILIALLRGGDYDPDGIDGCGANIAHALARCGFGDKLLEATRDLPPSRLPAFLDGWRTEIRAELRSNSRGFLKSKKAKLAKSLPDTFPDIDILQLYTDPETSECKKKRPVFLWDREPDLMKLAALCERKFEWGVSEIIVKRFRTVMWAPVVLRIMRRAVLDTDSAGPSTPRKKKLLGDSSEPPGTPSKMIAKHFSSLSDADADDAHRLVVGIRGKREHASTDGMAEYRLEIAPAQLVRLTEAGVQGHRVPPSQYREDSDEEDDSSMDDEGEEDRTGMRKKGGLKKPPPPPESHLRVWMPACIVELVEPAMVAAYEGRVAQKAREKEDKAARRAARAAGASPKVKSKSKASASGRKARAASMKKVPACEEEEEEELSAEEDYSHVFGLPSKSKNRATHTMRPWSKVKTTPILPVREEEEEDTFFSNAMQGLAGKATPLSETTNSISDRQLKPKASSKQTTGIDSLQGRTTHWTLTGSPKRKTILDLLDEHHSQTRIESSTTSVSIPEKNPPSSQPARSFVPKPFPMSLVDSDDDIGKHAPTRVAAVSRSGDAGKGAARNSSTLTSESDTSHESLLASPKKSPRRNRKHGSPSARPEPTLGAETVNHVSATKTLSGADSFARNGDEGVELDRHDRSASPSPIRQRISSPPNDVRMDVVSTSLIQHRKTSTSARHVPSAASQPFSRSKPHISEIIELTSSSESEHDVPPRLELALKKQSARTSGPSVARRIPSEVSTGRINTMFPTVKPKTATTQKAFTTNTKISRRAATYDADEIIEIL